MNKQLTRGQFEILDFARDRAQKTGVIPSIHEIATYLGMSKDMCYELYEDLKNKGCIKASNDNKKFEIRANIGITSERQDIYLYLIRNKINKKLYIGQTTDPEKRWYTHKTEKRSRPITNAIRRFGADNFEFNILRKNLTQEEANNLEIAFIERYGTQTPNGYNGNIGPLPHNRNRGSYYLARMIKKKKHIKDMIEFYEKWKKRSVKNKYLTHEPVKAFEIEFYKKWKKKIPKETTLTDELMKEFEIYSYARIQKEYDQYLQTSKGFR